MVEPLTLGVMLSELLIVFFFAIYLFYKGLRRKNHPKIILGISFFMGFMTILFNYLSSEYLMIDYLKLEIFSRSSSILGFVFVALLLLLSTKKKELITAFSIIVIFLFLSTVFIEISIFRIFTVALNIINSLILILLLIYIYYTNRDNRSLIFLIASMLLFLNGMIAQVSDSYKILSNILRVMSYIMFFISFEYDRVFKRSMV